MFWREEAAFASCYAHWLSVVNFQLQNERKALLFLRMTSGRCDQITWIWAIIGPWHNCSRNSNTPSLPWLLTVRPPQLGEICFVAYHVIYLVISSNDSECMQQQLCRLTDIYQIRLVYCAISLHYLCVNFLLNGLPCLKWGMMFGSIFYIRVFSLLASVYCFIIWVNK